MDLDFRPVQVDPLAINPTDEAHSSRIEKPGGHGPLRDLPSTFHRPGGYRMRAELIRAPAESDLVGHRRRLRTWRAPFN